MEFISLRDIIILKSIIRNNFCYCVLTSKYFNFFFYKYNNTKRTQYTYILLLFTFVVFHGNKTIVL